MMNVACYVDLDDCIADGLHMSDCDGEGYCNHCGSKDGISDPPGQRTFEWLGVVGGILPIASHPEDLHRCEDTGEWKRRDDCLLSYDGKAWWDHEERYDYEVIALMALAKTLSEGVDDRIDHIDSINSIKHAAFNGDSTWREYVGDYYRDDVDDCTGHTDHEFEMICDDLRDRADTEVRRTGYSDFDHNLTSWDVGEVDDQIMLSDHPLLEALHGRNDDFDLEFMLNDYDCDHEFASYKGKFVSKGQYPSINLRLVSDKTYWWGCSHDTMFEVYHNHVDGDE